MKLHQHLYLSLFLVILTPALLWSQASVVSAKNFGGTLVDEGQSIFVQDTNRIILGARSFSSDENVPDNFGGTDFWVSVLDKNREFVWSHNYGGFNNDDLSRVAVNSLDQVIAFGTTRSETNNVPGIFGAWLVGLHPNGQMLWSATYGGYIGESGVDLFIHDDDDISILVKASSPELYGDTTHGVFDFWLAKLNPVGTRQWSRVYGGDDSDIPTRLLKIPSGYLMVGYSNSESGDVSQNRGGFDYWVIKVDNLGEIVWERTFGGSDDDRAYDVVAMPNGDFVIVGESESQDGDKTVSFGGKDVWVVRINSNGNLVWQRTYGGTDHDIGRRILYKSPDKLYIGAHSISDDVQLRGNKGLYDYWFVETTLDGILRYQMNYGGTKDEFLNDMFMYQPTGEIFLCGTSSSSDGNVFSGNYGESDAWVLTLAEQNEECDVNLDCFVQDVGFTTAILYPESNEPGICDDGCTVGSPGGPPLAVQGCPTPGIKSAWYKVRTDSEAQLMTFSITSTEFNDPQVAVLQSKNCNQFDLITCGKGENGLLVIENVPVEPDTAYYIVVGDGTGLEGSFRLCVTTIDIQFCNLQDRIYPIATSLGSPLEGPYKPGEDVTLCYELTSWQKLECNGLQGIVPSFGPGWDSTNFDIFGMPMEIDSMIVPIADGFWDWYSLGDVHYNFTNPEQGYQGGQGLPPGWYFINNDSPEPNGEPDDSYGDIIHCEPDSSMWKVCFTLTTRDFCEDNLDCSVSVKTFSDGEIGENVNQSCKLDQPTTFESTLACCINPFVSQVPNFTICSGDSVNILFESTLNPPVSYMWEVSTSGSVIGAEDGQGPFVIQQLINLSDVIQEVVYSVRAVNAFCETGIMQFVVSVRPTPTASLSLSGPANICEGQTTWLRADLTGTPPFFIQLVQNSIPQETFLSEDYTTFIPVSPTVNSVYSIFQFEDMNCPGSSEGAVSINVKDAPEMLVEQTICEGDTFEIGGSQFFFPGLFNLVLPGEAANGCDSTIIIDLDVLPTSASVIDTVICQGESITVGKIPYTETGNYEVVLTAANGCDSTVSLFLEVVSAFYDSSSLTLCFGETVEFGGNTLTQSGIYFDSIPLTPMCDSIYIFNLTVLSQIQLSETVIVPDSGLSTGQILINFQGGLLPFTYQWAHGSTLKDQTDLAGGDYFLTVTDANDCHAEFQFFVPLVSAVRELTDLFSYELRPNPAPASQDLQLHIDNGRHDIRKLDVEIYQLDGKRARPASTHEVVQGIQQIPLDISGLHAGLYLVRISNPETGVQSVERVVIE